MKKYKLIKKLPFENSPKIGYISKSHTLREDSVHYYNGNWFYPDKYPEFWQEVVEKDYEVLSLLGNDNKVIPYLTKTECIDFLVNNGFKIYSVKRKDGEIFTIGDKVTCQNCIGEIKKFFICGVINIEGIGTKNNPNMPWSFPLTELWDDMTELPQKVKQPLFTTEDGMDIFEGDEYFRVATENKIFNHPSKYIASINNQYPNNKYPSYHVNFSTKEKAEEYILMNKPCLSLNDIAKVYVSAGFEITKSNKNMKYIKQQLQLRELIKTKLKKAL